VKIAIVGSGIAGLVAARGLSLAHELEVFEAGSHIGGHTHTHELELGAWRGCVDTGFIVFNERTYPNFCALLRELGVAWQASDMGFSVRVERSGLEWNGRNLDTLFAQRSNLLRPSFHRMVRDVLRFAREARTLLDEGPELTLGAWLDERRYSREFVEHYLVPMGAAIWSSGAAAMREFPARFLARFFHNHGMLAVEGRPQWLTVRGGSARYVEALVAPFADRVHVNTPVRAVRRDGDGVELVLRGGETRRFDHVVIAAHSDQALAMLADASRAEREILGALRYQENEAVLHTDERLLPRLRKCWASWNYHVLDDAGRTHPQRVALTYWMNRLQALDAPANVCVTLNRGEAVDPRRVLKRITYHHPQFTREAVAAQARWSEINGARNTWFCGAYWRFGFHEDGVVSGLRVVDALQRVQRALEVAR
jgi:uncharacterized protein